MTDLSFRDWMQAHQARFEAAADRRLPEGSATPRTLHEAMRWGVLGGGKRVRPLLCYAAAEISEASDEAADAAAFALECIHSYSLIHDDLPCMDNDMMRHGKPSTHAEFGYAEALLAGDALQTLAFETLADDAVPKARVPALLQILSRASGSRGMCGGQAIDLQLTGRGGKGVQLPELRMMHLMKTGALIRASVLLGGSCAESAPSNILLAGLSNYGSSIGLAFQVKDDILDVTADSATLGKTAGKDAAEEKSTYVTLLGLNGAKALAEKSAEEALAALDLIDQHTEKPESTRRLREIADFILKRDR